MNFLSLWSTSLRWASSAEWSAFSRSGGSSRSSLRSFSGQSRSTLRKAACTCRWLVRRSCGSQEGQQTACTREQSLDIFAMHSVLFNVKIVVSVVPPVYKWMYSFLRVLTRTSAGWIIAYFFSCHKSIALILYNRSVILYSHSTMMGTWYRLRIIQKISVQKTSPFLKTQEQHPQNQPHPRLVLLAPDVNISSSWVSHTRLLWILGRQLTIGDEISWVIWSLGYFLNR